MSRSNYNRISLQQAQPCYSQAPAPKITAALSAHENLAFLSRPDGFSKAQVLQGRASSQNCKTDCNILSRFRSFTAPIAHLRWQESANLPAKSSTYRGNLTRFKRLGLEKFEKMPFQWHFFKFCQARCTLRDDL